jgi:sugar (pentulose or hexulose) kinase
MKAVCAGLAATVACFTTWAGTVAMSVPNNYVPDGFYRYAPSTLVEAGERHVFYCRNINSRVVVDGIYHAVQAADGTLGAETLVLAPADSTGTAWDSYHVADPSVIAGAFYFIFNALVGWIMGRAEKRLSYYR